MKRFSNACLDVLSSRSVSEYRKHIIEFANDRGFGIFSALVVTDHSPTLREFSGITNAPAAYLDIYHDVSAAEKDPVSQHCKLSDAPIVWNADTYACHKCSELWDEQAPYGFKSGVAVAIHLPHGKHFFFGIDRDGSLEQNPKIVEELICDFKIFTTYAQASAFELILGAESDSNDVGITERELDALRYTMDGESSTDISKRIGASPRTIDLRLQNAVRKLGCSNKYEAVLRAIRFGYIAC